MSEAPSLPVLKRDRICYLLDHWDDIFGLPVSGVGGGGDGSPHLSAMSRHPSVVELVRCLGVLKGSEPRWHDHLKAYYCAETRIRRWDSKRKRRGGKVETVHHHARVRVVPGWVAMGYVRSGEFRLKELFVGAVFIPSELWEALTLSSEEIAVREAGRRVQRLDRVAC